MQEILGSLIVPMAILIGVGAVFVLVQMTAAVRVGETAAMSRLKRWRRLPEAILRLFAAPNIEAAVQGMTLALAEGLAAKGSLALVRAPGRSALGGTLEVAASNGTLRGESDDEMLQATLAVAEFSALAKGTGKEDILQVDVRRSARPFRNAFRGVRRGRMIAIRLRLAGNSEDDAPAGLIVLHVVGRRRLDRFNLEAVEAAISMFPRVVEAVTSRFAQAEVMEQLLEEARVKDGLLRMLLGSYQHDLGNTLASLQAGLLRAWEAEESLDAAGTASEAQYVELYRTIQLVANVARSGEGLVDIAGGKSPPLGVEPHSPAEVFEQLIMPFISLRARRRPELVVETEIPIELPPIYIDRVAYFRVLSNVLHNAFKYTREGSVKVSAHEEGDLVVFAVSDTGPGIPANELPLIGEYEFRASPGAGQAGRGVGMWVTRRLMDAMGGTFKIESEVGKGSTFYLGFAATATRLDPAKVLVRAE